MNDKERVRKYMDGTIGRSMRFCGATGPCACLGCISQATPEQAIEYLADKIRDISLIIEQRKADRLEALQARLKERKDGRSATDNY